MPAVLVLVKATAVLLVALALTTLMQRASATSRHLVWVASLLALLALPMLAAWSPVRFEVLPSSWGFAPVLASDAAPVAAGRDGQASDAAESRPVAFGARSATAPTDPTIAETSPTIATVGDDSTRTPVSFVMMVVSVWAVVAAAVLAWLAYGSYSVRRIVRSATPLSAHEWQGTMIDIADRLELAAIPQLLRSETVTMPFACGLRQPTIVLPAECENWTIDRRSAVLLHELAHIRRRDMVGHTLGRLVCALYWFHPLAWTAARRLRAESERACDDLALGCGTRASDYAEHLLDIVTSVRNHATPSVAMAMATRSEFEGRMLAILDPTLMRSAPTRMQASTLAGGVMMFAIVTGSAVPRAATSPQQEPPMNARSTEAPVFSSDSGRVRMKTREVVRTDTLTRTTEGRASARTDVSMSPQAVAAPLAVAVPLAEPVESPSAVLGSDRRRELLREMRDVRTRSDSSARAGVLARILRSDTSASLRRTAAWGLNDFTDNSAALEALVYAVRRDPSAAVREMAAWALSDAADKPIVAAALADAIRQERERSVKQTAVWSLGDGGSGRSSEAINALISVLDDEDAEVRELAAWGIGNARPKRAPAALVALLSDRSPRVRSTAAWALYEIKDGETAPAIEAALNREMDADVKWALVRAIGVMGEQAVAPLQRLIESGNASVRALAIRSLAGQGAEPWPQPRPRPRPFP